LVSADHPQMKEMISRQQRILDQLQAFDYSFVHECTEPIPVEEVRTLIDEICDIINKK
jgi:hypothetical protein